MVCDDRSECGLMHVADCQEEVIALYLSRKPAPDPSQHRCPECDVTLTECSCGFLQELNALAAGSTHAG